MLLRAVAMALTGPRPIPSGIPPEPAGAAGAQPTASGTPPEPARAAAIEPTPSGRAAAVLAALAVTPLLRLAALRHAVPPDAPALAGCVACGAPVGLRRPWPALGPLARCGRCRARVGPPPATVELAALAAVLVLALLGLPAVELAAVGWWLAWAIPLSLVDVAVHRLPDRLTYPAAAGVWALLGLAALSGTGAGPWLRATLAGAGLALFFATTTLLLGRRGFGLGDAKLALGAGLLLGWYGWPVLVAGLLLALGLAALVSLGLLLARRARWSSHVPFGPFLVLGTVAGLLLTTG
ncbi:A24 family peptidase [Micromonospora sp. WMMD812]|uniref:prepilin peptidase n=1 Tax=Micromonospora sp. WMMD812 TaxID=3015152 RepID=UPI00248C74A3|nr:A24 family peptidase [Micromonospora sp. WMMD812]WBB65546.1 A24 family peptidase [Micromonospora sp. WMMD812]